MATGSTLVHRSTGSGATSNTTKPDFDDKDDQEIANNGYDDDGGDSKSARLTLMEEILLLGLKDREVRATHVCVLITQLATLYIYSNASPPIFFYVFIKGYTSFWNDCISSGLRGCMIVELALRGRVELEKQGMRRKGLLSRKLLCKNPTNTGDVLLDEALKHIKETSPPDNVQNWIELLSGRLIKVIVQR